MKRSLLLSALFAAEILGQQPGPRFRLGDDPAWASTQFDDSDWTPVAVVPPPLQGADLQHNVTWTRWRIQVPSHEPMLFQANCLTDCRMWLDGVPTGNNSGGPVQRVVAPAPPGKWVTVAVRSWLPPGAILMGQNAGRVELLPSTAAAEQKGGLVISPFMLPHILTALALAGILLYLLLQTFASSASREVRIRAAWMAVFVLCNGGSFAVASDARWSPVFGLGVSPSVLAILGLAGGRLRRAWIIAFVPCFLAIRLPYLISGFFERPQSWTPLAAKLYLVSLPLVMAAALVLSMRARRHGAATWLMAAFVLAYPMYFLNLIRPDWFPARVSVAGVLFGANHIATLILGFAVAIDVVLQQRREQAAAVRLQGELDSGRQAQLELVSSSAPRASGYEIEIEYEPAAEVGGDFYLILPRSDGATLLVVGDVSGKGLKAAMRTSFMIALIRTHREQSPDALLTLINQALDDGAKSFVTACAAVLREDGQVEYANAGHLAPLSNGSEWPVPDDSPLGVVRDLEYTKLARRLEPGVQLTLLTDGVLEAENPQRELFGFDRTREISTKTAQEIADAAQAWGQNDDITVVTVRRNP